MKKFVTGEEVKKTTEGDTTDTSTITSQSAIAAFITPLPSPKLPVPLLLEPPPHPQSRQNRQMWFDNLGCLAHG